MGEWTIVIEGRGMHHNNGYPKDSDTMLKNFIDELKTAGHVINHASFTYSGRNEF